MAEEGHLPSRDVGRTEASAPMEHKALSEILPVEMIDGNFPLFPSLFNFTATSFLFLDKFCYNNFQYLFKTKGIGTFLQTHALILKKKEHLDSNMFHYYCIPAT